MTDKKHAGNTNFSHTGEGRIHSSRAKGEPSATGSMPRWAKALKRVTGLKKSHKNLEVAPFRMRRCYKVLANEAVEALVFMSGLGAEANHIVFVRCRRNYRKRRDLMLA